jgi:hypothetical protein
MSWRPRRLRGVIAAAALLGGGCVTTGALDYVRNGFKVGPNYCEPPAPAPASDFLGVVQLEHHAHSDVLNPCQVG